MAPSTHSFEAQSDRKTTVVMDKQEAVGSDSIISLSHVFDSGCNLSGVSKVHMHFKASLGEISYPGSIKYHKCYMERIFLEFKKPLNSSEQGTPFYDWLEKDKLNTNQRRREQVFVVPRKDSIVRIDVWYHDYALNAIRFHLESGSVSELYGILRPTSCEHDDPTVSFEPKHPGSKLVGIHGKFGDVIHWLGFTFAKIESNVCNTSSIVESNDDSKSLDFSVVEVEQLGRS